MPLEMNDPDGDAPPYPKGPRFGEPDLPWWRPTSTVGRVFLGFCALIVLGGLAAGAYSLKTYVSRDPRFRIAGASNIQATGLTEVSRAEMLPVFGEDIGRNIFFVPLAERRKQLEEIPWVERATVMRLLPDQISVSVVERQPVAFVRQGQQIGLVDASGVLLSMPAAMMAQRHYSFPVVTGLDARDSLPARKARMDVYQRLLAELDANNQRLSEQISEIDLTDPEDARVLMPEQGEDILAHFGEDRFLERYHRYKAHIAEWRQQYPKLSAVDLRYESQVVLEMAPGSTTAAPPDQSAANPGAAPANPDEVKPPPPAPAAKALVKSVSSAKPATAKAPASTARATAKTPTAVKAPQSATKAAGKQTKIAATPSDRAAAQAKIVAARLKAAKDLQKRLDAKNAALNTSKKKSTPIAHPAAVVSEGQ
jgi:cell division protein FtsQ